MVDIPKEMKALQIEQYHEDLTEAIRGLHVITKATPKPSHGQILVRMEAAPCNPSDLLLLQGRYGSKKKLPTVPGWEGAGTVVANGGGIVGTWLMGKRVACVVQGDLDGTWGQYVVVDAKTCIPLKDDVSIEQGATLIINPFTAVGMVETARKGKHAAIIQTAAASQVGRMVLKLARDQGIPVIHIVRRKDQEDVLRSLGAEIVLNSETEHFREELKKEAAKLKATIAFDAVGGSLTGTILTAMPNRSKVLVYGSLSMTPCSEIGPLGLIFQQKSVEGFWLSGWLAKKGFWGAYRASNAVQRLMADGSFQTTIREQVRLEDASKAIEKYHKEMTLGKIIITPQK